MSSSTCASSGSADQTFAEHVWTDHLSIEQVADRIAGSAGLTLSANPNSPIRGRPRPAWTRATHIGFD